MKKPDDFESLEALLRQKAFSELTSTEKAWVLQQLDSEETYTALRITELQLQDAFQRKFPLAPRATTRQFLHNHLSKNASGSFSHKLRQVLSYSIPAYQAALGLLVALVLVYWMASAKNPKPVSTPAGFAFRKDTIFITRHDTVFMEKTTVVTRYKPVSPSSMKKSLNYDTTGISVPDQITNPKAQGVSMKEDTLLQSFFRKNQ